MATGNRAASRVPRPAGYEQTGPSGSNAAVNPDVAERYAKGIRAPWEPLFSDTSRDAATRDAASDFDDVSGARIQNPMAQGAPVSPGTAKASATAQPAGDSTPRSSGFFAKLSNAGRARTLLEQAAFGARPATFEEQVDLAEARRLVRSKSNVFPFVVAMLAVAGLIGLFVWTLVNNGRGYDARMAAPRTVGFARTTSNAQPALVEPRKPPIEEQLEPEPRSVRTPASDLALYPSAAEKAKASAGAGAEAPRADAPKAGTVEQVPGERAPAAATNTNTPSAAPETTQAPAPSMRAERRTTPTREARPAARPERTTTPKREPQRTERGNTALTNRLNSRPSNDATSAAAQAPKSAPEAPAPAKPSAAEANPKSAPELSENPYN